jgi:hypothetical protein
MDMDHLIQIITVNGIAAGLAMDAFAVSVVSGAIFKELHIRHALRMAFFFGAFQAVMPLLGYAAANTFSEYIVSIDHWIAFALLVEHRCAGGRVYIDPDYGLYFSSRCYDRGGDVCDVLCRL